MIRLILTERDGMMHILEPFLNLLCTKTTHNVKCTDAQARKHIILAYFLLRFQLNSSAENEALKQKEYIMTKQNLKLSTLMSV